MMVSVAHSDNCLYMFFGVICWIFSLFYFMRYLQTGGSKPAVVTPRGVGGLSELFKANLRYFPAHGRRVRVRRRASGGGGHDTGPWQADGAPERPARGPLTKNLLHLGVAARKGNWHLPSLCPECQASPRGQKWDWGQKLFLNYLPLLSNEN